MTTTDLDPHQPASTVFDVSACDHPDKTRARCCNDTGCRRKTPIRVFINDLTGRAYALTRYTERTGGRIYAVEKHDVTDDVNKLLVEAEDDAKTAARAEVISAVRAVLDDRLCPADPSDQIFRTAMRQALAPFAEGGTDAG